MTVLAQHLLSPGVARENALGGRSFLESCLGVIAGGMAAQGAPARFFPGFRRQTVQTSGTTINVLVGGDGPPVLLLHGYPQTHVEWRKIAPELAKNYTLVISDLRGYGDSGKPPDGDNHINYSKRAMALDQVEVMEKLGFREFAMVSHDRGARVGHRLALDYPDETHQIRNDGHLPHTVHVQDGRPTVRLRLFSLVLPHPTCPISGDAHRK